MGKRKKKNENLRKIQIFTFLLSNCNLFSINQNAFVVITEKRQLTKNKREFIQMFLINDRDIVNTSWISIF